jgi:hypothetical protein
MSEEYFDCVRKEFGTLPELLAVLADPAMFEMMVSGRNFAISDKVEMMGYTIVEPMAVHSIRIWRTRTNCRWIAEVISRAVLDHA